MRPLSSLFRQAWSLSLADVWVVLQILGMVAVLPVLVRVLSLPKLLRILDPGLGSGTRAGVSEERMIVLTRGLLARKIGLLRPNCVTQSLVLYRLLRKSGTPTVIRFGVAKKGQEIEGHCWLETDGEPVAEEADPKDAFSVVYSFPEEVTA